MIVDIGNFKTIKILSTIYFGKQTSDFDFWFSFQKQIKERNYHKRKIMLIFLFSFPDCLQWRILSDQEHLRQDRGWSGTWGWRLGRLRTGPATCDAASIYGQRFFKCFCNLGQTCHPQLQGQGCGEQNCKFLKT